MKIKPLDKFLLLKPYEESKTSGGLFLPTQKQDFTMPKGIVLDVGENVLPHFKEGSIVVYNKGGENEINVDQKELFLVKEDYIMAIIYE